ncbi:MAG TPA: hypothetical protein VGN41_06210 [Streptosporangiaceae bacterium]
MKPVLLTSTVTPLIFAVFRLLAAPAAPAAGLLLVLLPAAGELEAGELEAGGEELGDELHAARAAAAAAAGSTSRTRNRAGPVLNRCALPPRTGIFRVAITRCSFALGYVSAWLAGRDLRTTPSRLVCFGIHSLNVSAQSANFWRDHIWISGIWEPRYGRCAPVRIRRGR